RAADLVGVDFSTNGTHYVDLGGQPRSGMEHLGADRSTGRAKRRINRAPVAAATGRARRASAARGARAGPDGRANRRAGSSPRSCNTLSLATATAPTERPPRHSRG